jgi:hypothetical protein
VGEKVWDAYWVGDLTAILGRRNIVHSLTPVFFVFARKVRQVMSHYITFLRTFVLWEMNGMGMEAESVVCQDTEFVQCARLLFQTKYMNPTKRW